jgi:hypothetical protein
MKELNNKHSHKNKAEEIFLNICEDFIIFFLRENN